MEDARRDEMKDRLHPLDDQGVAGVVPALKPGDDVGVLGVQVHHLALALVPPLGPHHNHVVRHFNLLLYTSFAFVLC